MVIRLLFQIISILEKLAELGQSNAESLERLEIEQTRQAGVLNEILTAIVDESAVSLRIDLTGGDLPPTQGVKMIQLTDTQQVDISIAPLDAKGKPAKIDGAATFTSSDPTVITVTPGADGLSATVVAGDPGTAQVQVSADADLSTGTVTITGVLDVTVVAGQAATLGITAGTPTEQTPTP